MEYPIPHDWDGESWKRWSICWPDSPLFLGYLRGFITYFTRGRCWDGSTGSIKDAQAIGWQIANNNLPLEEVIVSCTDGQWIAKAILFHAAVTGGFAISPFPEEITNETFNVVDFRNLGLANRIGPEGPEDSPNTIQATLERLRTSIDALTVALQTTGQTGEDLEDDLANVWRGINDVVEILGGEPTLPPDPL